MKYICAVLALCAVGALRGQLDSTHQVQVTKTEKVDFPADGTLRLENSTGEVTIEGWDEPGVEITTTKTTKALYSDEEHGKGTKTLDRVRITTKREGNELVIATQFPRHSLFPWALPLQDTQSFTLEYRIKAPRNARLKIRHNAGEVHIDDITGDIDATAVQGLIALRLGGDAPRAIDAKADSGSINSWFPGKESLIPVLFGHRFVQPASAGSQKLRLRIGYGDIVILKEDEPSEPRPTA